MSLAFQRIGKCGEAERSLLMDMIEDLRGEIIDLKADLIRERAEKQRLRNENWKLKRGANEQARGSDREAALEFSGNGTGKGART